MGLAFLLVILLYVALLIGVTIGGYHFSRKRGWSLSQCRLAATAAFLLVLLPVFWDWLPTVWLHSHYCSKFGGLTVSNTMEQWRKENPGVAETLARPTTVKQVNTPHGRYFQLNQRIRWDISVEEMPLWLVRSEHQLIDVKDGKVIARFVDFSTGQSGRSLRDFRDFKVWMYRSSCEPEDKSTNRRRFNEVKAAFDSEGDKR